MDIEIRAEAVMEPKDYLGLTHFITFEKAKSGPLLNMLVIMLVFIAVYADFRINNGPTIITVVAVIAAIATYGVPEFSARQFIKKDTSVIGHHYKYLFDENGINLYDETAATTALFAWATMLNMYEVKDYFYVFMSKQNAIILPKRCLNAEDMDDFREVLKYKLGKRFEQRYIAKKKKPAKQ